MEKDKSTPLITYKGTDKDMKCRGFQYEVGGEYEEPKAKACSAGFHACEHPLDVLGYYPPGLGSRYFEVEQSGDLDKATDDTKVASTKLKVCGEIGIPGLVKAAVEYTMSRAKPVKGGRTSIEMGAASATGVKGAASATGEDGIAIASGYQGRAKGALGCVICLAERKVPDMWAGKAPVLAAKAAIVDGKTIKADTWYTLKNGEFVEVEK